MRMILLFWLILSSQVAFADPMPPQNTDEATLQELAREQDAQKAAYEALSRLSPMSQNFNPTAAPLPAALQGNPALNTIQKWVSAKKVQALVNYLSSPQFTSNFQSIQRNPNKLNIIYAQISLFLLLIFYRAWKSTRILPGGWMRALWLKFWTATLYMITAGFGVPYFFLGEPYYRIGWDLFQILIA